MVMCVGSKKLGEELMLRPFFADDTLRGSREICNQLPEQDVRFVCGNDAGA